MAVGDRSASGRRQPLLSAQTKRRRGDFSQSKWFPFAPFAVQTLDLAFASEFTPAPYLACQIPLAHKRTKKHPPPPADAPGTRPHPAESNTDVLSWMG
jgi:hypothetical protein